MNRLKSVFIGIYLMTAVGITGYAAWQLHTRGDVLPWSGPLLTVVPFLVFLSRAMIFESVARARLPGIGALALAGVAMGAYVAFARREPLSFVLAAIGAAAFGLYSSWYSVLKRTPSVTLALGSTLPDLELKGVDGRAFHTRSLLGQPALLFFFRGNWCPLCMAQIKEVAARYREISETGARVVLISPQPHTSTAALASRFDVPFVFLTDERNHVARALGIEAANGLPMGMTVLGYDPDTVLPTVIVLDAKGVIRWLDQTDNYRVRPEPDTFLPILRRLSDET